MSIFYDVPSIGNKTEAQKGPTCWFYAAKMIRKFHDAYDKTDHGSFIRIMSLVRKIITFMDEDLRNPKSIDGAPPYAGNAPNSFRNMTTLKGVPYSALTDPFDMTLYKGFMRYAAFQAQKPVARPASASTPVVIDLTDDSYVPSPPKVSKVPTGAATSVEYEQAFHLMQEWGQNRDFNRQQILGGWGFVEVDKHLLSGVLNTAQEFEKLLVDKGPLWVGGLFEGVRLLPMTSGAKVPVIGEASSREWVHQWELGMTNTHAIAVLGVGNKSSPGSVLYRDPNFSTRVFTMPFDDFAARMRNNLKSENVLVMFFHCNKCQSGFASACIKQDTKRAKVSAHIYP